MEPFGVYRKNNMAVDTIQEASVWGVNENGAVVLQADTAGTSNVVGYINSSQVPQDVNTNKMVVKLPAEIPTVSSNGYAVVDGSGTAHPFVPRKLTGNIGRRKFAGRLGSVNNTTASTYQVTCALSQGFDAIRIVLVNNDSANSYYVGGAKVSVIANTSDLNNSAGTWVSATKNGQAAFPVNVAKTAGSNRPLFMKTDSIPISSLNRDDGGVFPLLVARVYVITATATLSAYGNGTDDFTNWATKPDGRIWAARSQTGDCVTTPSTFTSTVNQSQSPIVAIEYLARGQVVNVESFGDSITEGRGDTSDPLNYLEEGFVLPACNQITNNSGIVVEYSNSGWSGQSMTGVNGFQNRLLDTLDSDMVPDVVVFPSASPNDVSTAITAAQITAFAAARENMIASCKKALVVPVIWTWLPSNTSVKTYAATDSLRLADNASVLAMASKGVLTADTSSAISGVVDGTGQVQMAAGTTTDGIHPNRSANATLTAVLVPSLTQAIKG